MMNRRNFLKWLGVGSAAAVVAPSILLSKESVCATPIAANVNQYSDYSNFSQFALEADWDEVVMQVAKELGAAAGRDIAALRAEIFT